MIEPIKISELDQSSIDAFKSTLLIDTPYMYLFTFSAQTFTSTLSLVIPISKEIVDSSVYLMFYKNSTDIAGEWYPAPGPGKSGTYIVRTYFTQTNTSPSQYTLTVRTNTWTGALNTTSKTFTQVRVYILRQLAF